MKISDQQMNNKLNTIINTLTELENADWGNLPDDKSIKKELTKTILNPKDYIKKYQELYIKNNFESKK